MHAPQRFEGPGVLERRRPVLRYAAIACGLLAALTLWEHAGALAWAVLVVGSLFDWASARWPLRRTVQLTADRSGLSFDGELFLRRDRIDGAYVLADPPGVRIRPRWRAPLRLKLASGEDAQGVVDSLGFGVGKSRSTFGAVYGGTREHLPWVLLTVLPMVLFFRLVALHGQWTEAIVVCAAIFLMAQTLALSFLFVTVKVEVGSDGVLLRRPLRRRFVRYTDILDLRVLETKGTFAQRIEIRLRHGRVVLQAAASGSGRIIEPVEAFTSMVQAIEHGRATLQHGEGLEDATALLAPGGRPVARWLKDLRALTAPHGYRQPGIETAPLWRVVEDSTATPAERAGAAVALGASLDDDQRSRLRVASDACAHPRLRVALHRIAEGADDRDVDEAVAPLLREDSLPPARP